MFDRIGDFAQSARMTTNLLQTQTRTRMTQAQISSGKVSDNFQDLAPKVERLLDVERTLGQNRQFQDNIAFADQKLTQMEGAMSGLVDLATRAKELTIQRINDPNAPGLTGPEFEHLLDQAVSILNDDMDGHFLFGGSQTGRRPVELDPTFTDFGNPDTSYYQGDDLVLTARIDVDIEVATTMSADREGFQALIGGLRGLIEGDVLDDDALLNDSLGLINDSLSKIADYQAELGVRQTQLTRVNEGHLDAEIYLESRISEIEDVDVTEAITRLAQDQVVLESAMATIARLNQLSLVNFL